MTPSCAVKTLVAALAGGCDSAWKPLRQCRFRGPNMWRVRFGLRGDHICLTSKLQGSRRMRFQGSRWRATYWYPGRDRGFDRSFRGFPVRGAAGATWALPDGVGGSLPHTGSAGHAPCPQQVRQARQHGSVGRFSVQRFPGRMNDQGTEFRQTGCMVRCDARTHGNIDSGN